MADATEREREALQMVFSMMATDEAGRVIPGDVDEANRRLDAARAAVRARLLADVMAVVEGELTDVPAKHSGTVAEDFARARNRTLHYLLTRLRAMEGHTDG